MIRSVLLDGALLLLPSALYLLWLLAVRPAARTAMRRLRLPEGPWLWLGAVGLVLVVASLAAIALTSGGKPGGTYVPPRYEGGEVVPARVE